MADQEDWTPGDVAGMLANPFYAINIDEGLALSHEPLISEDDWGKANVGLIEEPGPEAYLRNLLSILKGNYPAADSPGNQSQHRTGTVHPVIMDGMDRRSHAPSASTALAKMGGLPIQLSFGHPLRGWRSLRQRA